MNAVAEDIKAILDLSMKKDEEYLEHYGMPRRSGRYPWGSGDTPYQNGGDFLARVSELKKQGWKEDAENVKKEFGLTLKQYRNEKAYCNYERDLDRIERARSLKEDGLGPTAIGKVMGVKESTVRGWLEPDADARMQLTLGTADFIKQQVDKNKIVDIGKDVEKELNISPERLDLAVHMLQKSGYKVYNRKVEQVSNRGNWTLQKYICSPEIEYKDVYNKEVHALNEDKYISHDGGETFDRFVYPKSMSSDRIKVLLYDDIGPDGEKGADKDGLIQIRRGVPDLSLGEDHYSQVRILVDDTKYMKGMAVYSDNMPDGVDIVFNTSKKSYDKALKNIEQDADNPFGAVISPGGQSYYTDKDGNRQLSLINKVRKEGEWSEWKDSLPSQFLAKQSMALIKKQLNLAKTDKMAEYDEICSIPNPTLKQHLLEKFADECDSAAVHLQAAALPGQKYHAIIPINTLKDNEVYAPQYDNGTKLALIRYPHGGTFEIPVLTVNNKHASARKIIGEQSIDAIGINKVNADKLSGADFDGDTVMCIPTDDPGGKVKIDRRPSLEKLKDFDPKLEYPARPGMRYMKDEETGTDNTQNEMGRITNLITDMTLQGASDDELARAVRHSMVVIDAGKHKLDYKRSEAENDIRSLKNLYQIKMDANGKLIRGKGASTIISRAKGQATVPKTQGSGKTNIKGTSWYDPTRPEGAKIYKLSDDLYYPIRKKDKDTGLTIVTTTSGTKIKYDPKDPVEREKYEPIKRVDPDTKQVSFTNKAGDITYKTDTRKQKSTQMMDTDDAYTLVSSMRHPKELEYANYANSMKALANSARKEAYFAGKIEYSANAKAIYLNEYNSLMSKLNDAEKNSPRERAAQRQANREVDAKISNAVNPKKKEIQKWSTIAINKGRADAGALTRKERNIRISDREWEAIQAGAITSTKLKRILNNTDIADLRERATPRSTTQLSTNEINRIKALAASNYTLEQIAKKMGKSPSTISKHLKGAK